MSKQTGPKTPEGKAKSSQNALKHGLATDRMFVLANENQESWDRILNLWTDKLQPRDEAEQMIVTDIAHAQWKIRRARTIEGGMIDLEMDEHVDYMTATFRPPIDEGTRMACAFKELGDKSRGLDHIHRYEVRARRAFKSGLAALEQLRRLCPAPETTTRQQPEPAPGTRRENPAKEPPRPAPVPAQRPAAQQVAPENKNLQNETTPRSRPYVSLARKLAIRRVREAFGNQIPIETSLQRRTKQA